MTLNRSGRSFADEIRAFAAFVGSGSTHHVRVLAYDYSGGTDWSFRDTPEVDAAAFEAILRSATRGSVDLSVVRADRDTLVVALEYFSDPGGRETSVWVNWHNTLDPNHPGRLENLGAAVLTAQYVPGPPSPPFAVGEAHPLAFDMCDGIAAVSFAALGVYPDIDPGWWCLVEQFWLCDGLWQPAGGSHDNTTTATPFERPSAAPNSRTGWIDWASDGGCGIWEEEPRERHSYFGIAPAGTAGLSVTTPDGRTRDVAITPWNGAWVVVAPGRTSTLAGRDAAGAILGETTFGRDPLAEARPHGSPADR